MDIIKRKDLQTLIETSSEYCISLFMPTHRLGYDQQQDPIRLKNLINQAEDELLSTGMSRPKIQKLLQPMHDLLNDSTFWQNQSDGLAIFRSPDLVRILRLPSNFDELLVVARKFHVKPLLPMLSKDGVFYVLAISMKEVRLYHGDRNVIDEVDLGETPTSLREALRLDDPDRHLDFYTGASSPGRQGMRRAIFHGQGAKEGSEKPNLLKFFQILDKGIEKQLEERDVPIVLAGVDYLLPIYHQASSLSGLLSEGLEGNPEEVSTKDLHEMALELVEPIFREDLVQAKKLFEQFQGQDNELSSNDLAEIVKAARFGRVETLFIPLGVQCWGRYNPEENKINLEETPTLENEDLLDFAAVHTLINDGTVFTLEPDEVPGKGILGAIFRYEL